MNALRRWLNHIWSKPNSLDRLVDNKPPNTIHVIHVPEPTRSFSLSAEMMDADEIIIVPCASRNEGFFFAEGGHEQKRTVCFHCGCPLLQIVNGFWTFDEQGKKDYFQEVSQ